MKQIIILVFAFVAGTIPFSVSAQTKPATTKPATQEKKAATGIPQNTTKPVIEKKANGPEDAALQEKIKRAVKPEEADLSNLPPIKMIEEVTKKPNEIMIPYTKYMLANGLTLIVHEDHSDPIVDVDVTYHVGSNREQIGKSGFAHFFEHMMFQGSDHVGDDQHFKIVTEAGGTLNGTTNSDRTNYFETLPSNQLETALWLESDRMGFLLDAVTQTKFENQRATVKNERGQRYDNRPYGLVREKIGKSFYPYGHPYSWPTIGYIEDLNRSTVDDLKKFFLRWYGPNNATVTVSGDVNKEEVVQLVLKYFGPIPRGPITKPMPPIPVSIESDRYISYEDNIRFPALEVAYPGVPSFSEDEPALDILAEIIGGGKNSIFYKNLVKTEKVMSASAFNQTSELGGQFVISVRALPDKPLSVVDSLVRASILEFEKRGVSDDDLTRFKTSYETSRISQIETVAGKSRLLAMYNTFTGNPNYLPTEIAKYKMVTKDDVMRVYRKYVLGKHAVVLSVFPKGKAGLAAKPDNFYPPTVGTEFTQVDYSGLEYVKAKDNFDRSKKPVAKTAKPVMVPDFWTEKLSNGMKITGAKNAEIPLVSMLFTVEAGQKEEARMPIKAGISYLLANLMNEGTKKYTAEQFEDTLDKLGSSISVSSDEFNISVRVSCQLKYINQTLSLLEEKIFNPKFAEEDFNRLYKKQLENISNQSTQPTVIASNVYQYLLFGKDNILSLPGIGLAETVSNIELSDVKSFYKDNFAPATATLTVVGDIEKAELLSKLSFFQKWNNKAPTAVTLPKAPAIDKTRVYLVDKDRAPQSEIRVGCVAMPYDATGDYYKSTIMNYTLGEAFNCRINMNLRESKGWTYGARGYFSGNKYTGTYTVSAGVKGEATDSSVVEIMKEIKTYRDKGITEQELSFTRQSLMQRDALKYESAGQKSGFLRHMINYDLDKSYLTQQSALLEKINKSEIDALAKSKLPADNMNIVIVGDAKSIKMKLVKLGYEVIEVDNKGNKK